MNTQKDISKADEIQDTNKWRSDFPMYKVSKSTKELLRNLESPAKFKEKAEKAEKQAKEMVVLANAFSDQSDKTADQCEDITNVLHTMVETTDSFDTLYVLASFTKNLEIQNAALDKANQLDDLLR